MSADRITTGTLDASKVTVKNLNANNITSGTISAERIDVDKLEISKMKISGQTAIEAYSTTELYIGGARGGGNFSHIHIYSKNAVYIGGWDSSNTNRIIFDTVHRVIRPASTNYRWSLGNDDYPFDSIETRRLKVYTGAISLGNPNSTLGFFGTSPTFQKSVSKVTGSTVNDAITGINNLITALKSYGLIS